MPDTCPCTPPSGPTPGYNVPQNGVVNPAYNLTQNDCSSKYPEKLFYSTNLNNYVNSYGALRDRIARSLGAPMVPLELHEDQVNENIAIAVEMYSKWAGFTKEALVFDSRLYENGRGIRLDALFALTKTINYWRGDKHQNVGDMYNVANMVLGDPFAPKKAQVPGTQAVTLPSCGCQSLTIVKDIDGNYARVGNVNDFDTLNSYDYMLDEYRRVVNVVYFEEGSNSGINTLFTIEQSLQQQAYNSYALGNFGFDLVSWYSLKNYLKDRSKVLAQNKSIRFDKRTQYMQIYPEPAVTKYPFFGIIECYVEKPIQDLLKEHWVQQYATALCKIQLGYIRGRFAGATMFGGVTINADIGAHGKEEKEKLEQSLYTGANSGWGEYSTGFFIG